MNSSQGISMKLVLTKHVQERRKKGNIPPNILKQVMVHLINQHNLENQQDGTYKFRKAETQAVMTKKGQKFVFITFFGPTGYVIDADDFGEFSCTFQSIEYLREKEKRKKRRALRKKKDMTNSGEPLLNLSQLNKAKLKKGTFEIIVIPEKYQKQLHNEIGSRPYHFLISKFNVSLVEILKYDGGKIKTVQKTSIEDYLC